MKINIKKLPKSEIEMEIEIPAQQWEEFLDEASKEISRGLKIEGFRPGFVPRRILEQKIGLAKILEKAADLCVKKTYVKALIEKEIEAISKPEITVLKMAPDNPFLYKVKTTSLPVFALPDYKKIGYEIILKNPINSEVGQAELDKTIDWLRRSRTKYATVLRPAREKDRIEMDFESFLNEEPLKNGAAKNYSLILGESNFISGFEKEIIGMKEREQKEFFVVFPMDYHEKDLAGQKVKFKTRVNLVQEPQLLLLDDEFAKSAGNFDNFEALKTSVRQGLELENITKEKQKIRKIVLKEIAKKCKIDIAEILIEREIENMTNNLKNTALNMGLPFETYLSHLKKTQKELEKEWFQPAQERIKNVLILRQIAKEEKIEISEEELEAEINKYLKHYQNAGQIKNIDIAELKEYTKELLTQEKVFELLENQ